MRPKVKSFVNELEQGIVSLTDEEFARLKPMIVERKGLDAAHVAVAPIATAQPCSPRSRSSKYRSIHVFICREITRAEWTRSEVSSNHHRLVRVLKHPDSSASPTGRWDELLPTAAYSPA